MGWRPFRDWPIRRKVLGVIVASTGVALLLAAAGILIVDSFLYRHSLERDLTALSQIIADNSTGALAFDDPQAAAETLGALRARPHLVAACMYRKDGSTLARYFRNDAVEQACPERREQFWAGYESNGFAISRPVSLKGASLGTLTILYDLAELNDRGVLFGAVLLPILLAACALGAVLSTRLRDRIAIPVIRLAETASEVSGTRDYSLRASKLTGDETGVLVDAFNDMLGRIQSSDDELRRMLHDREEANRELTRLNEDLERFAFVASHDLREPLRMITVYTQLLQRRVLANAGPEATELVGNIIAGSRRMRELIDDLRAYAELGAPSEPASAVELEVVVEKAVHNLALSIASSHARVTWDHLPSVNVYEGHLVPLFQNLIGNAVKYRGAEPPRVHIAYTQNDELEFVVSDNGLGIAPEFHETIFVAFKRLHGADIPGSGLGLAICRRVVERYGGRIWVESRPGQGSKFCFTLPVSLLAQRSVERVS